MKNVFLFLSMLVFTCPAFAQTRNLKVVKAPTENLTNEKRKAIVIGMSDYGVGRSLDNTLNDADDMADVFTRLGFEVTLLKNNDLRNLKTNLTNWYNTIEGNAMAVFFFAGHGLEVGGQNFLVPVDAEMNSQTDVEFETINVNQVLGNMDERRVGMKLLILDACRDNPFIRSWNQGRGSGSQGLAGMSAPRGTYIAFAAAPGSIAHDGGSYNLRNGVFTHFIKREILKAGASIDEIFNKVAGGVADLTNDQQTPFKNSSLRDNFYFIPLRADNPPVYNPPPSSNINVAELVREADTHYENKRYNDAIPLYRKAAEQGNADGQNGLGNCYKNGNGVTKDYNQAVQWYRKASEQGNAIAQYNLGECYYWGYGVTKDYNQAVQWYRKAAEQGYANAQKSLGGCYYSGSGVTQDFYQAVTWYRQAAEQGNAEAFTSLGFCYRFGQGVIKDIYQENLCYDKAAELGDQVAQMFVGDRYCYGYDGFEQDINKAVYWYKKAADQGHPVAKENLFKLGISYP